MKQGSGNNSAARRGHHPPLRQPRKAQMREFDHNRVAALLHILKEAGDSLPAISTAARAELTEINAEVRAAQIAEAEAKRAEEAEAVEPQETNLESAEEGEIEGEEDEE